MDTIIEILIDNSNSMGPYQVDKNNGEYLMPDNRTRMEWAKDILMETFIPEFDFASKITVRLFHSVNPLDQPTDLKLETIYEGVYDKDLLLKKISEIPIPKNTGGTPITAAIENSIEVLSKHINDDRKILLVTDGEENGPGNYKTAAENALQMHGIPCNIHVVGIAQNKEAERKAHDLSKSTGGIYINLTATSFKSENLQKELRQINFGSRANSIENITSQRNRNASSSDQIEAPTFTPEQVIQKQSSNIVTASPAAFQKTNLVTHPPTPNQETNVVISPPKEDDIKALSESVIQNTTAINLIGRQLNDIMEELRELRSKATEEEDEEPIIKENSELNERVRLESEKFLYEKLQQKYGVRVKWMNENGESGNPYDFIVNDNIDDSVECYIECKASKNAEKIFYVTDKEWDLFLNNINKYKIYFVANALDNPALSKIDNPLESILNGHMVPYVKKNIKQKANRIVFSIVN